MWNRVVLGLGVFLAVPLLGPGGETRKSTGDPVLDHRIDVALRRGTARLVRWLPTLETRKKALVLFAALEGGASKKNPVVAATLKSMIRYHSGETVETSFRLMLYQKYGGWTARKALFRAARELFSWQKEFGGWHGEDTRNKSGTRYTNYVLLGLRAAFKAGAPIPRRVVTRAADFLLRTQSPEGGFHDIIGSTQICGNKPRDTLTAGAIASLAICKEMAGKAGLGKVRERKVRRATESALLWLDKCFEYSLPEERTGLDRVRFLYALERAMILLGKEELFGKPWYAIGARYLLNLQMPDGSWENDPSITAFAVLFLARSFRPLGEMVPMGDATQRSPEKLLLGLPEKAGESRIVSLAGKLAKLGLAAVPACLKILRGPSPARRRAAAIALERITGLKTGFDPVKSPSLPANQNAARAWEKWWMKHRKSNL